MRLSMMLSACVVALSASTRSAVGVMVQLIWLPGRVERPRRRVAELDFLFDSVLASVAFEGSPSSMTMR